MTLTSKRWMFIIGYIASFLTIFQAISSIILLRINDTTNFWQIFAYQSALVLCVISLCILLINSQLKNERLSHQTKEIQGIREELEKENKLKENIIRDLAKYNHNINHQHRQMVYEFYDQLFLDDESTIHPFNIASVTHKFRGYLQNFTTNVKQAFDTITEDSCSVYISFILELDEETGDCIVQTYYRDATSYTERTNIDLIHPTYNVSSFTPYKVIMDKKSEYITFSCDNCSGYKNFCDRNDNWEEYYNSCLVVPIRVREDKEMNDHNMIGFLTVDNKKGKLDNKDAKNLLCSFADLLYLPFNLYIDLVNIKAAEEIDLVEVEEE